MGSGLVGFYTGSCDNQELVSTRKSKSLQDQGHNAKTSRIQKINKPWPVWLSGWSVIPITERLWVRVPVRAHT